MSKPIPFTIDRNLMVNFAEQTAEGFRTAIKRGYYRAGDLLPSQGEIAEALGVSIRIPREAYRILERESLVRPRRRVGCEVVGRDDGVCRGRVLLVYQGESEGSYAMSVRLGAVRRRLEAEGYLVTLCGIDHKPAGRPNLAPLTAALHVSYDFAAVLYPNRKFAKAFSASPTPVLYEDAFYSDEGDFRYAAAMDELLERCRALGVGKILLAGYWPIPGIEERIRGAGFALETKMLKGESRPDYLEDLVARSVRFFTRRFSGGRVRPDAVLCIDDYVARGALAAFAGLGVRMPDDVRFATLANAGHAPASAVGLAKIECDPRAIGAWMAERMLAAAKGWASPSPAPPLRFIDGESLSGDA